MRDVDDWPFKDPKNLACITTLDVIEGKKRIGLVSHDADDGGWQFLPFGGVGDDDDRGSTGRVIGLAEAVQLDPTVAELADLPLGWVAFRKQGAEVWTRQYRSKE